MAVTVAKCHSDCENLRLVILWLEDLALELERSLVAEMETWQGLGRPNTAAKIQEKRRENLITKCAGLAVEVGRVCPYAVVLLVDWHFSHCAGS